MTTKNKDKKLKRVNLRLWEADLAYLQRAYPDNYNAQIRRIVGNWVRQHQQFAEEWKEPTPLSRTEIPSIKSIVRKKGISPRG